MQVHNQSEGSGSGLVAVVLHAYLGRLSGRRWVEEGPS